MSEYVDWATGRRMRRTYSVERAEYLEPGGEARVEAREHGYGRNRWMEFAGYVRAVGACGSRRIVARDEFVR